MVSCPASLFFICITLKTTQVISELLSSSNHDFRPTEVLSSFWQHYANSQAPVLAEDLDWRPIFWLSSRSRFLDRRKNQLDKVCFHAGGKWAKSLNKSLSLRSSCPSFLVEWQVPALQKTEMRLWTADNKNGVQVWLFPGRIRENWSQFSWIKDTQLSQPYKRG